MGIQTKHKPLVALGLMSGTSLDGIDVALIRTDGERVLDCGPRRTIPYDVGFRQRVRVALGRFDVETPDIAALTLELTERHAHAVDNVLADAPAEWQAVDVIGFHGQTLYHAPDRGLTVQIGNGALLSKMTGRTVVSDFRTKDVTAGGQGAPLVPVFHRALVKGMANYADSWVAVLNLGGVGNVTIIPPAGDLLACDTGPGNALIDDWVFAQTGESCDRDGQYAKAGVVNQAWLTAAMTAPYFAHKPPKSLDRNAFPTLSSEQLSLEDGAATLTAFTVASVAKVVDFMPQAPKLWVVCGGGRQNSAILAGLRQALPGDVITAESCGWDGDAIEAQAFGFLAVRSLYDLPLTFPGTTGVCKPKTGGRIDHP
jgi:anhydro-N-acetylmuramic acid kinase